MRGNNTQKRSENGSQRILCSLSNPFCPDLEISLEVIPFTDNAWSEFPTYALPEVMQENVKAVAEYMRVDEALAGGIALAVMSSACQHFRLVIKAGTYHEWATNLNLYVMIRAERGERKTPIATMLSKPIYEWEKEINQSLAETIRKENGEFEVLKVAQKRAMREADKNPSDEADKALKEINEKMEGFTFTKPIQAVCDDSTTEALGCILNDNQGIGTIISTEGGLLDIWSGSKYGSGVANADIPLKAFSGESFRVNRTGRASVLVDKPVLTILLCIQQVVLEGFIENRELVGKGLIDRFLFIVPRESIGEGRFYTDDVPAKIALDCENKIRDILNTRYTDGVLNAPVMRMTKEATECFADWHDRFQQGIRENFSDLQGWASKHVETVARIAGIFQVFDDHTKPVSLGSMQRAIVMSDYFQEQVKIALRGFTQNDGTKDAEILMKRMIKVAERKLKKHNGELYLTSSEITQECKTTSCNKRNQFNPLLEILTERGMIATPLHEAGNELRTMEVSQATKFFINPSLLNG